MKLKTIILLPLLFVVAAACAKKEEILEGPRFDIRTPLAEAFPAEDGSVPAPVQVQNRSQKIRLPAETGISAWTHRNGTPEHRLGNPALGRELTRLWSADIGAGNSRRARLTADPVVAGGLIFTMDSAARVMAHSPIGSAVWVRDLTPPSDRQGEVSGGGLAWADGVLYATTGYGEVVALNAADGRRLWRQKLDAPVTAAPTVFRDRVFVVSRDNRAWALKTRNGRIDWQQQSTRADAGLLGGASPAAAGRSVILPFSSGELISALTRNGLRSWSVAVSGGRPGQGLANIGDISSDPVVTRNRVYAANQSGRLTAVSRRDGKRIWTAKLGSYSPVWPVDDAVFLVSDSAQLVRLDARDGSIVWAVDLPRWRKDRTRRDSYVHYGPVLAGGRLIVASSDGGLRSFDPVSGALLSVVDIPSGAASHVAIAGGVLYVLGQNGQLHAYR